MSQLLFIVSLPRSGSTLLQGLVSNNDFVETVSEPWVLLPFLSIFNEEINQPIYNQVYANNAIKDFIQKIGGEKYYQKQLKVFLEKLYEPLQSENTKYILDKTPRYYEILNEILVVFPEAKVIILKRNPLAILNSIVDTWDVFDIERLVEFHRDLLSAPFILQNFIEDQENNPNVKEVVYENIVTNSEIELQAIYEWLGIPFSKKNLNYIQNKKFHGKYGDKVGVKKHTRPVNSNVDKWKQKLNDEKWEDFFRGYAYFIKHKKNKYNAYKELEKIAKPSKLFEEFIEKKHELFITKDKIINLHALRKKIIRIKKKYLGQQFSKFR